MAVLKTSIADNDWALVEAPFDPKNTGDTHYVLTRKVENIDTSVHRTLMLAMLAAGSAVNPVASGVTYTGTFYFADLKAVEQDERSVTIIQTLSPETQSAQSFPWENRSLKDGNAYVAERTPGRIVTRTEYVNEKAAPGGVPTNEWGSRRYHKNLFDRFDGYADKVHYSIEPDPGSDADTWIERRTRIEQDSNCDDIGIAGTDYPIKCLDNVTYYDQKTEGHYWRIVVEKIRCKITYSNAIAEAWADTSLHNPPAVSVLIGSFCHYMGRGKWYAERVVERLISKYVKFSRRLSDDVCSGTFIFQDQNTINDKQPPASNGTPAWTDPTP